MDLLDSQLKSEMSNESIAADPPLHAASVLYHCDEVDRLFASLFAIRLTEVGNRVLAFYLPLSYISRGYNPSLIQFFLGSLYPVHIKRHAL